MTLQETLTRLRDEMAEAQCERITSTLVDADSRKRHFANGFTSAQDLLLPLIEKMKGALEESKGCWDAAYFEGLPEAMNDARNGHPERLVHILDVRLLFALRPIIEALSELKKLEEGLGK